MMQRQSGLIGNNNTSSYQEFALCDRVGKLENSGKGCQSHP